MRWIVTDNIYAETWSRLLEYSNIELTIDQIIKYHGQPHSKTAKENYKKQATQARVCVLQAKEYFDAAQGSTLYTSPNHAYYGAIALASLTMLVHGNGDYSLDVMRKDNRNNHHGLNFTTSCNAKSAASGTSLLENSLVETLDRGHFRNWYNVLPKIGVIHAQIVSISSGGSLHGYDIAGHYEIPGFDRLRGKKKKAIDLLKYLPDLDEDLQRYGISVNRSRTSHDVTRHTDGREHHQWRIHGCRFAEERDALLNAFKIQSDRWEAVTWNGLDDSLTGIVSIEVNQSTDPFHFSWPNCRDNMNHETISYADMEDGHEIVDLYFLSYQLSMLSRYFPDIWVSCIESQCRAAKLIERAVSLIVKKLPILTLSILTGEETIISTHLAPWKK